MVTVWGELTAPTFWLEIARLVGETVTAVASETPEHWKAEVAAVLAQQSEAIAAVWSDAAGRQPDDGTPQHLAMLLRPQIDAALRGVLLRLYPQAPVPVAARLDATAASV